MFGRFCNWNSCRKFYGIYEYLTIGREGENTNTPNPFIFEKLVFHGRRKGVDGYSMSVWMVFVIISSLRNSRRIAPRGLKSECLYTYASEHCPEHINSLLILVFYGISYDTHGEKRLTSPNLPTNLPRFECFKMLDIDLRGSTIDEGCR